MISRDQFEEFVKEAIEAIPEMVQRRLENVAFVVEDEPRTPSAQEQEERSGGILLGLYEGVSLPDRSAYYSGVLPDKITIFKSAVEEVAGPGAAAVRREVFAVIHHEIAHYLGMDEAAVRAWERQRNRRRR